MIAAVLAQLKMHTSKCVVRLSDSFFYSPIKLTKPTANTQKHTNDESIRPDNIIIIIQ